MDNKLYKLMNWPRIEGIIYSEEDNPHEVLGPRSVSGGTLFQAFFPEAESVQLILKGNKGRKMERMDEAGFFACLLPGRTSEDYEYEVHFAEGVTERFKDAYRYTPGLDKQDVDRLNAGIFYESYEKLGAHPMTIEKIGRAHV